MHGQFIYYLAKQWVDLYLKNPVLTPLATFIGALAVATLMVFLEDFDQKRLESKRLENNNYQTQLNQLNDTEKNIKQLLDFVKAQQTSLRDTEDTLSRLKSEKEKLQPLIEMDKAAIEAIFKAQEERTSASVWRERIIGFAIGIIASLIASFIWYAATIFITKKARLGK